MYRQRKIAVVVPIHNEELFISQTVQAIPAFVDLIVVVDDGSSDQSATVVTNLSHAKISLIRHAHNCGVGAATISGYRAAQSAGADIIVVMDGDGQMDGSDMPKLLDAIIVSGFDYVKGNRFLHATIKKMPRLRYLANCALSKLMQSATGIKCPLDAQCGYSAIASATLARLSLENFYPRYGFLNDLLFNLAAINVKIGSVPVHTVYGQEISDINPFITVPVILYIILSGYLRRIYSDSNPDSYSTAELQ